MSGLRVGPIGEQTYTQDDGSERSVQDKLREIVSPEDFGAEGDGVEDDTDAIADLIASGKDAFFPVGKTYLTDPVTKSNSAVWSGKGCLKLKANASGHLLSITADDVSIYGLKLDGNGANQVSNRSNVYIGPGIDNTTLDGLEITGAKYAGILTLQNTSLKLRRLNVHDNLAFGGFIDRTVGLEETDIVVENNGTTTASNHHGWTHKTCENIKIRNMDCIENAAIGVEFAACTNVDWAQIRTYRNGLMGISHANSNNVIGNGFDVTEDATYGVEIAATIGSENVKIAHGSISGYALDGVTHSLTRGLSASGSSSNIQITDWSVKGCTRNYETSTTVSNFRSSDCTSEDPVSYGFNYRATGGSLLGFTADGGTHSIMLDAAVDALIAGHNLNGASSRGIGAANSPTGITIGVGKISGPSVTIDPNITSGTTAAGAGSHEQTLTADSVTPTVGALRRFKTANTVATTITNFVGGTVSQIIVVRVTDANTTFQNGANIKTKTGANVAGVSGCVYEFECYGTDLWSLK